MTRTETKLIEAIKAEIHKSIDRTNQRIASATAEGQSDPYDHGIAVGLALALSAVNREDRKARLLAADR